MARIAGVDLPNKKRAEVGLTYIFGIGRTRSKSILHRAGVDADKKVSELSEEEVNKIRQIIENSRLPESVRQRAMTVFTRLAEAEAAVRDCSRRNSSPIRAVPSSLPSTARCPVTTSNGCRTPASPPATTPRPC